MGTILDDCTANEFTYNVNLPLDDSSPSDILFSVTFVCEGVITVSALFDNADDALDWATQTLGDYGDWTLDGNTLILSNSICGNSSLSTQSYSSDFQDNATASIELLTADESVINNDLWCFSLLNINFTGSAPNMTVRNVLDSIFKTIISDLHAKALQYAGGAITNIYQVTVGKTNYALGGGYLCSDCGFGDGQCCPTIPFTQDFYLVNVELCRQLGIGMDISANVQLADITWQAQIAWQITHQSNQGVALKQIMFAQENVTRDYDIYWIGHSATNDTDYTNKANAYIAKVNPELVILKAANPTKNFYLDTSLIEETGSRFTIWNTQLSGYTNQGVRQYFNLNNLLAGTGLTLSTTDWAHNLSVINTIIFTTAVTRLNSIKAKGKKAGIYQWGLRNPNITPNLENTVLGMLLQAKMIKMMLDYNFSNSDLISYASYQDLKQFINNDNTVQNFGKGLILIGKLFTGTTIQYIPITFNFGSNVTGVATYDGSTYRILIINDGGQQGGNEDGITINGTFKETWSRESYYGNSLGTTTIIHTTTTEHSVFIPENSISVFTMI